MIVTLKPINREEIIVPTVAEPRYSSSIFGGYESAEVECEYDPDRYIDALGGRLRIGRWQGIVTRRPGRGEPMLAKGWGWNTAWNRREVAYYDTQLSEWEPYMGADYKPDGFSVGLNASGIVVAVQGSATYAAGTRVEMRRTIPATNRFKISGIISPLPADFIVKLYSGETYGGSATLRAAYTASGAFETTVTGSADISVRFWIGSSAGATTGADTAVGIGDLVILGASGVTSTTAHNVIDDILDNEVTSTYMASGAASRAWIGDPFGEIFPLVFKAVSAEEKLAEVIKYSSSAYDWGWYTELVSGTRACVPHLTVRSATPDYVLKLSECEEYDVAECSLDELVSAVRVTYTDTLGKEWTKTIVDTDATHPLVALGMTVYGDLDVQTNSSAYATTYGNLYLSEKGRQQVKGFAATKKLQSSTGADVYLPSVRPGKMVRAFGVAGGYNDCTIKRASMVGDALLELELDNTPYRLDVALAELSNKAANR